LRFHSAARTHVGRIRELNEDAFAARPQAGLWAVADGMGGHSAGDVASARVVEALGLCFPVAEAVQAAVAEAHADLRALGGSSRVIGSTLTVLMIAERRFSCLWAGDSRAYRLDEGGLARLTRDHTLAQALVDGGAMRPEEAATSRQAHIITRAVGVDPLVLDLADGPVARGDRFLLCTDGLTGHVTDAEISDLLASAGLEAAADQLLALALERGGRDNVTVVLVEAD
jgi:serine/threonine protein phosphatase PrpC